MECMSERTTQLERNLGRVREQIAAAARRAGRSPATIRLVAVTKYVDAQVAAELVGLGCEVLGESRPQQLWEKAEALAHVGVRWHMIGHLQRNKIRRTMPLVSLIESADSLRLLNALESVAAELDRTTEVLLEVNVSGDLEKHGFAPNEIGEVCRQLDRYDRVRVRGVMAMASREGDLDAARRDFRRLRALRDSLIKETPAPHELAELSMGMTRDFEVAIEEGSTIVRIGSALFEGVR